MAASKKESEGVTLEVGDMALKLVLDVFKQWDVSGDGDISRYELHLALNQLGFSFKQIDVLWEAMDANGDGKVEYREFLEFLYKDKHVATVYNLKISKQKVSRIKDTDFLRLAHDAHPDDSTKHVLAAVLAAIGEGDLSYNRATVLLRHPEEFREKLTKLSPESLDQKQLKRLQDHTKVGFFKVAEMEEGPVRFMAAWALAVEASCAVIHHTLIQAKAGI